MKKAIAIFLIITGIALMAYPKLKEFYYDRRQAQLLESWQHSMAILERQDPDEAQEIPEGQDTDNDAAARAIEQRNRYIQQNMEGTLKIDKINLNMPILKGATEKNLLISVSSLTGPAGPGEVGNYCIAGHRCRTTGRHFNKLDRLEKGDSITVTTKDAVYSYEVFESLVVRPEETWVLMPEGNERLITLITCDYSEEPSLRLIVRGRLVAGEKLEG
ncbi:MAG: class D sortase [Clostridia bacterium]